MNLSTTAPVAASERAGILDALRGFAILGIFLDNIFGFTGYGFFSMEHREALPTFYADGVLGGLEMSFASEVEGEHVHLYLGYVTSRKLLNFSMVCQPGKHAAAELFNATVPGFRPRLP